MQRTTPATRRAGLSLPRTSRTVSSSLPTPCRARKWACMGMITSRAAERPLIVSRPSEGGQSIRMKSKRRSRVARARARRPCRSATPDSSDSAAARSVSLGIKEIPPPISITAPSGASSQSSRRSYTERATVAGSTPRCRVAWAWGSRSTISTRRPREARPAPRLTVVVVLPTPPFWFISATTRAGAVRSGPPCSDMSGVYRKARATASVAPGARFLQVTLGLRGGLPWVLVEGGGLLFENPPPGGLDGHDHDEGGENEGDRVDRSGPSDGDNPDPDHGERGPQAVEGQHRPLDTQGTLQHVVQVLVVGVGD